MTEDILATLHSLRDASRRSTLISTFALAAGVIMIPLTYRGGVSRLDRWLLVGTAMAYVIAAAVRVAKGLRLERQLDGEERFVRMASRDGMTAPVRSGRRSAIMQAMRRAEAVPPAERRRALLGALRRSVQRLGAPPGSISLPLLIVLGIFWIRIAMVFGTERVVFLFVAVIVVLALLLAFETYLLSMRFRLRSNLDELAERVVAWWASEQADAAHVSFTHEIRYRDVAERLGLT